MNDPGRRRPWVPYRQWVREREAERLRVPGVLRNERARHARERREGVRMPPYARVMPAAHRDPEVRRRYGIQARAHRLGDDWVLPSDEEAQEQWKELLRAKRGKWHEMHTKAARFEDYFDDPEEVFDRNFGNYGGRYEEFLYQGDREEPEETHKRLRDEEEIDVNDLPVITPGKKVKFEDEAD